MIRVLVALHAALVLGLAAGAVAIWRLHCESFGCMGVGIAWFAWAVCYFVVLGLGALVRPGPGSPRLARFSRAVRSFQLLAGAVLLAAWAAKSLG